MCYVYCLLFKRCKFIIDWHNYTYTILSLTDGVPSPDEAALSIIHRCRARRIVRLAKWFEHFFGQKSSGNLCVTQAMQKDLRENWEIKLVLKNINTIERNYFYSNTSKHRIDSGFRAQELKSIHKT